MNALIQAPPDGRLNSLRRRAAALGPGYRGLRRPALNDELARVARELEQAGEPVPRYLIAPTLWLERRSKLFEAATYPDKGVEVTADDLERIAANFDLPVPVMIEHAQSPFEIGYLTQVEALGDELFGTLSLSQDANALIERSEARKLSVGLSPELDSIREVSIVQNPRVASAQMFTFALPLAKPEREAEPFPVERLVREGGLTPAQAPLASAIASANALVVFEGARLTVGELLVRMIERQPKSHLFGEFAPQSPESQDGSAHLLLPEEAAFYRKHFPEISLDQIASRKTH